MKNTACFFFALLLSALWPRFTVAQTAIQGIVFDKHTKQRISQVYIYNTVNDQGGYNNTRGEFDIQAGPGDVLIAAVKGYHADTLVVSDKKIVLFHLERSTIWIDEVSVVARRSPEEQLLENKRAYSTAYAKGDAGSIFSVGPTGAGLSIDALYKLISREGKNARRLQEIIERDYRESVIDYRFTPELVSGVTGLTGTKLADFMRQYRPSYYFLLSANDYNLTFYIRSSFAQYRQNPGARRLPALPKTAN
ncbi:carboxypeptidase-like regulatory domain-containing protein [Parapedobacter tibetensis]|uniref:carboxypeptidase-like regulatory domain-containing protein n=1 Tax=Parapedobacter tibetensis TaxID=2972951 RepID=UPI00214D29A2|nr:carboxypeptidase-like regulatory domain-containing protein [Parapedobacter tibetensis]